MFVVHSPSFSRPIPLADTTTVNTAQGHRTPGRLIRLLANRGTLWLAFALLHAFLGTLALVLARGFGDVVTAYQPWAVQFHHGTLVGIHTPWVYPIGALVPILLPLLLGPSTYVVLWVIMVVLLDAGAFAFLIRKKEPQTLIAAWWWLTFMTFLGLVSIGRLDAVSVPIALVGALWLTTRPRIAAALLSVATWIKVWPAAILLSAFIALGTRWRIFVSAILTSAVILAVPLALGSGTNVTTFITAQTGRGIQIEAPVATVWMWLATLKVSGVSVYFHPRLLTFQVSGPGTDVVGSWMNVALAVAAVAVLVLGLRALRRRASAPAVLATLSLALVTAFIAINKVGSPQYVTWLTVPVMMGLVTCGRRFRTPAFVTLAIALLTQCFSVFYMRLVSGHPVLVSIMTMRNVLEVALLFWAVAALWRLQRPERLNGQAAALPSHPEERAPA